MTSYCKLVSEFDKTEISMVKAGKMINITIANGRDVITFSTSRTGGLQSFIASLRDLVKLCA